MKLGLNPHRKSVVALGPSKPLPFHWRLCFLCLTQSRKQVGSCMRLLLEQHLGRVDIQKAITMCCSEQ